MKRNIISLIITGISLLAVMFILSCKGSGGGGAPDPGDWVTVGIDGIEYTTTDGITVSIPEYAVMEDTRFYVRKLSAEDIDFFIQERGIAADNILFAIEGADGVEFSENITLTFKVESLDHSIIPVIHTLDMTAKTFSQGEAVVTLDPSTRTVTLEVSHFCALAAEIQDYYRQKGEAYCSDPETSCRCGRIKVEQGDSDFSCSDKTSGCQVVSSESTVTYLDCDPVLESVAKSEEVCEDCVPVMDLTADRVFVNPGGSVLLSSLIRIGCAPFDNQLVSFAIESGAGTLSPLGGNTGASGSSGVMKTTLTAGGSEGKVTVSASSDIKYYYSQTFFSLTGEDDEEIKDPEEGVSKFLSRTIDIYVTDLPELELVPGSTKIEPGAEMNIEAFLTRNGEAFAGQTVTFTVSGPGTLSSGSGTTSPAVTTLTATGEGTITVTAKCNVSLMVAGESVVIPVEKSVQILCDEVIRSFHITVNVGPMALSGSVVSFYSMSVDSYSMNYEFDLNVPGSVKGTIGAFGLVEQAYVYNPDIVRLPDVIAEVSQVYSNFEFISTYEGDFDLFFYTKNLNAPSSFRVKPDGLVLWDDADPALEITISLSEDDGEYSPFTYDVYCEGTVLGTTTNDYVSRIELYQVYFYPSYFISLFDGNVVERTCRINVGGMKSYEMPITITVEEIEKK